MLLIKLNVFSCSRKLLFFHEKLQEAYHILQKSDVRLPFDRVRDHSVGVWMVVLERPRDRGCEVIFDRHLGRGETFVRLTDCSWKTNSTIKHG